MCLCNVMVVMLEEVRVEGLRIRGALIWCGRCGVGRGR